jgi:hypothetical protein
MGSSKNRDLPFWRWAGTIEFKNLVLISAQHLSRKAVDRRGDELTTDYMKFDGMTVLLKLFH